MSWRSHWHGMPPARLPALRTWKAWRIARFSRRSAGFDRFGRRCCDHFARGRRRQCVLCAQRNSCRCAQSNRLPARLARASRSPTCFTRRRRVANFCAVKRTELAHCLTQVERAAAAHASVAFKVTHQGRTLLVLPAQPPRDRALRLMPEDFAARATRSRAGCRCGSRAWLGRRTHCEPCARRCAVLFR